MSGKETGKQTAKAPRKVSPDEVVRARAAELAAAIAAARAAGYVVRWPSRPEGLAGIAVSETKRVRG